jgi:hypothetical protein
MSNQVHVRGSVRGLIRFDEGMVANMGGTRSGFGCYAASSLAVAPLLIRGLPHARQHTFRMMHVVRHKVPLCTHPCVGDAIIHHGPTPEKGRADRVLVKTSYWILRGETPRLPPT